jgi:hypothetical protein
MCETRGLSSLSSLSSLSNLSIVLITQSEGDLFGQGGVPHGSESRGRASSDSDLLLSPSDIGAHVSRADLTAKNLASLQAHLRCGPSQEGEFELSQQTGPSCYMRSMTEIAEDTQLQSDQERSQERRTPQRLDSARIEQLASLLPGSVQSVSTTAISIHSHQASLQDRTSEDTQPQPDQEKSQDISPAGPSSQTPSIESQNRVRMSGNSRVFQHIGPDQLNSLQDEIRAADIAKDEAYVSQHGLNFMDLI